MKMVFFGSDDFSVIVLEQLKKAGLVPARIVTTHDKPRGRGLRISPSPVSFWAQKNNVVVSHEYPPASSAGRRGGDYSLFLVASYGKIIPKDIVDIPRSGALNVHPSLLPKYRGPSPIQAQILADEKDIGVTIIKMDEKMDHGPIVGSKKLEVRSRKCSELRKQLAEEGGKLLAEVIPRYITGEITPMPQDESGATYTRKYTKEDGFIDLTGDPYQNFLKIQAFEGNVGAYFYMNKSTSVPPPLVKEGAGGGFLRQHLRVKIVDADFRDGKLHILRVIPEGKKEMSYVDFLRGMKVAGEAGVKPERADDRAE